MDQEIEDLKSYMLNPIPFLEANVDKKLIVKLKWGQEYIGMLASFDKYFNLRLLNTEEWVNNQCIGNLGEILIRCNNVLYMREYD